MTTPNTEQGPRPTPRVDAEIARINWQGIDAGKWVGSDFARELEREVLELREWQPIESAPLDEFILVYLDAPWRHSLDDPKRKVAMKRRNEPPNGIDGEFYWEEFGPGLGGTPTHWMPLPEPPTSARAALGR